MEYLLEPRDGPPPRDHYVSSLRKENISEETYNGLVEMWNVFNIKDVKTNCLIYCMLDSILVSVEIKITFFKNNTDNCFLFSFVKCF